MSDKKSIKHTCPKCGASWFGPPENTYCICGGCSGEGKMNILLNIFTNIFEQKGAKKHGSNHRVN